MPRSTLRDGHEFYEEKRGFRVNWRFLFILWCMLLAVLVGLVISNVAFGQGGGDGPLPGTINGVVLSATDGQPIAGATVEALFSNSTPPRVTHTDNRGLFIFEEAHPGDYVLEVSAAGYQPARRELHLPPEGDIEVRFLLEPAIAQYGEIRGVATNAVTSEPVVHALVFVRLPGTDPAGGDDIVISDRTDERGHYELHRVPAGPHQVHICHEEYYPQSKPVHVHSGLISPCHFRLEPRPPVLPGRIVGFVTDAVTQAPIAGASITVDGIYTFAPVLTDERGHYEFPGVPAGEQVVHAHKDGYHPGRREVLVPSGQTVRADFALHPELPPPPGRIAGRVVDGATSEPLAGARVYYHPLPLDATATEPPPFDENLWPFVETNDHGHYDTPPLRPGAYAMRVRKDGYYDQWRQVRVLSGEVTEAHFRLRPRIPQEPGAIAGQVVNRATSDPIAGALVYYSHFDDEPNLAWTESGELSWPHVVTNNDGHYRIPELRPGGYCLLVRARGYDPARTRAEVVSGHTTRVDFQLVPHDPCEPGRIYGQVVDVTTSHPIVGAFIYYARLRPDDGNNPGAIDFEITPASPYVRTNPNGVYMIPDLRPGRYLLVARAKGFESARQIAVVECERHTRADFALTPQAPPAPGAIAGRVTDARSRQPIAGAYVFYGPLPNNGTLPCWVERLNAAGPGEPPPIEGAPHVRTNSEGRYHIPNLPPGHYILVAFDPDHYPEMRVVEVQPGATTERHFALEPREDPAPGAIAGRVIDLATSAPIPGAWVFYEPLPQHLGGVTGGGNETPPHDAISGDTPHVRTNEHGHYRIAPLRPGAYHLLVRAEGYRPAGANAEVDEASTTVVNFVLEPHEPPQTGAIFGRVVSLGATPGSATPIAGARVYYQRLTDAAWALDSHSFENNTAGDCPPFVETDADGRYRIAELEPGHYRLYVRAAGHYPQCRDVGVPSGAEIEANFALHPLAPATGVIYGHVTDALTSEPLRGVHIWILPDGAVTIQGAVPLVVLGEAITDERGRYRIGELPPGPVIVHAAREGYRPARRRAEVLPNATVRVDFALQPIVQPLTGNLEGVVRVAETGRPIPRALVVLIPHDETAFALSRQPDRPRYTLTDREGHYEFLHLPAGGYHVQVSKRGYHPAREATVIEPGQTTELNFHLRPRAPQHGSVAGRVVDALTSEPLANAWVCLVPQADNGAGTTDAEPTAGMTTRTNDRGYYAFQHVPVGEYVAHAVKRGYHRARRELHVAPGELTRCNFRLEPIQKLGAIGGTVTDALTGNPVAGALLFVPTDHPAWTDVENAPHARSDEDGHYLIEGVPVGRQIVVAVHPGYFQDAQLVHVAPNTAALLDFALIPRPGGRMALRVRAIHAHNGLPASGVHVQLPASDLAEPGAGLPNSLVGDPWAKVFVWSAITGESGDTLIRDIAADCAAVQVQLRGHPSAMLPLAAGEMLGFIGPQPARQHTRLSVTVVTLELEAPDEPLYQQERHTYTYQWRKNGVDIPGATEPTLDTSSFNPGDVITGELTAFSITGAAYNFETESTTIEDPIETRTPGWWLLMD